MRRSDVGLRAALAGARSNAYNRRISRALLLVGSFVVACTAVEAPTRPAQPQPPAAEPAEPQPPAAEQPPPVVETPQEPAKPAPAFDPRAGASAEVVAGSPCLQELERGEYLLAELVRPAAARGGPPSRCVVVNRSGDVVAFVGSERRELARLSKERVKEIVGRISLIFSARPAKTPMQAYDWLRCPDADSRSYVAIPPDRQPLEFASIDDCKFAGDVLPFGFRAVLDGFDALAATTPTHSKGPLHATLDWRAGRNNGTRKLEVAAGGDVVFTVVEGRPPNTKPPQTTTIASLAPGGSAALRALGEPVVASKAAFVKDGDDDGGCSDGATLSYSIGTDAPAEFAGHHECRFEVRDLPAARTLVQVLIGLYELGTLTAET